RMDHRRAAVMHRVADERVAVGGRGRVHRRISVSEALPFRPMRRAVRGAGSERRILANGAWCQTGGAGSRVAAHEIRFRIWHSLRVRRKLRARRAAARLKTRMHRHHWPKGAAMTSIVRCAWSEGIDQEYLDYHDNEWGVPVRDDNRHFEFLILEAAQAGLS